MASRTQTIRFGECLLDPSIGELDRLGSKTRLQEQPWKVLELLLARPGEVVSREEFIAHVWPAGTVVDFDTAVNTAIRKLRAALGDDAEHPRYIETIPRRGYRLIMPIDSQEQPSPAPAIVDPPLPEPASTPPVRADLARRYARPLPIALLALLILVTLIAAVAWWHFRERKADLPDSAGRATELPSRTIAVLPFENLSTAPGGDVLALGMADSVLYQLSSLDKIAVIARTSSFAFRGQHVDVRDIGRKLNARYLVEGSVQNANDRLRVTAELIDATTGGQVWSLRFDRRPQDVFAVQDEIAGEVARALKVSLDSEQRDAPGGTRGTANLEAYLAFLRGRALVTTRRVSDVEAALQHFARAAELDPGFAAAYVELANAHLLYAFVRYGQAEHPREYLEESDKAAPLIEKAIALNDRSGEAYIARATLESVHGDSPGAEADFRRGLALSPNAARGYQLFGEFLLADLPLNKHDEGLAMIDRARELDPLEPRGHYVRALQALSGDGTRADAETLLLRTLEVAPNYFPALARLATIDWTQGRFAHAVQHGEQALALEPRSAWLREDLPEFYLELGEPDAACRFLQRSAQPGSDAWLPLYVYRGEWRRAGALVYAQGPNAEWLEDALVLHALREHAHATGELARARQFLEARTLRKDARGEPIIDAASGWWALTLADILRSVHEDARAERLLRAVLKSTNGDGRNPEEKDRGLEQRQRARALALIGESSAALDLMGRMISGSHYARWWYFLQQERDFTALRGDARFQALLAEASAHAAGERALLQEMRRGGVVPDRAVSSAPCP